MAEIVNKIQIQGNKKILSETIIEYGNIKLNQNYTLDELNDIQKKIYSKGFFDKLDISLLNGILTITVKENPIINFLNIQGEKDSEKLNKLYDSIELKNNQFYTEYKLKKSLEYIKEFYSKGGFSNTEVDPRVSIVDDNKANIIINITKNEQLKIDQIFFIGDKKFTQRDLASIISSSEDGWWKFLSSTTYVTDDRISYDKELLKNFYLDNGYYDVQIASVEILKTKLNRANIIYSINAGNSYNFGNFQINEGINLIDKKTQDYIFSLKNDYLKKNYSRKKIRLFLDQINKYFQSRKIDFINTDIQLSKRNNSLDLYLKIFSSNKQYIGRIELEGNSITKSEVILRNLTFSEGDSFMGYKKDKSLDNLKSLNIFKDVIIESKSSKDNLIDVKVKVVEKPTGQISAGAGYGSNGAQVLFSVSDSNLFGDGVKSDISLNIGSQQANGSILLVVPDYKYSGKDLYTKLFSAKTNLNNTLYESKKIGSEISTKYQIYENYYFKPGVGIDNDNISVDSSASAYLKSQRGNYFTQKIMYSIENDERDKKFNTRSGYIFGFGQDLATLYSDVPYIKSSLYGSNYFSLTEKNTINLKYGYSNISSFNNKDTKLSDRIFVPSAYSKGFQIRSYGPRDSSSGEYIGGNNTAYTSLSSNIPTPFEDSWKINSIIFLSAFNVWGVDNSSASDSNKVRSAIGIGFDYSSPLGPVNVNWAKSISQASTDKTKIFSFEIGTIF